MGEVCGEHGADQSNVIHLLCQVRHDVRNFRPGLPGLDKLEGRGHQATRIFDILYIIGNFATGRLSPIFLQGRLRIKKIHLAGASVHK